MTTAQISGILREKKLRGRHQIDYIFENGVLFSAHQNKNLPYEIGDFLEGDVTITKSKKYKYLRPFRFRITDKYLEDLFEHCCSKLKELSGKTAAKKLWEYYKQTYPDTYAEEIDTESLTSPHKWMKVWNDRRNWRQLRLIGLSENDWQNVWPKPKSPLNLKKRLLKEPWAFYQINGDKLLSICVQFGLDIQGMYWHKIAHNLYNYCIRESNTGMLKRDYLEMVQINGGWPPGPNMEQKYGIIRKGEIVYLNYCFYCEKYVGTVFGNKNKRQKRDHLPIEQDWVSELSEEQFDILKCALRDPICVITGGAGTGKSTLVAAIVKVLEMLGETFYLTAQTGKAVHRLTELIQGNVSEYCATMHLTINSKTFKENASKASYIIFDEFSMINMWLMRSWMNTIGYRAQWIFVGDVNQLEPVDPIGQIAIGLLESGKIPIYNLTQVFRAENQLILGNSEAILSGQMVKWGKHFSNLRTLDLDRLMKAFKEEIKPQDFMFLAPTNVLVEKFNLKCQKLFTGEPSKLEKFLVGDRVILCRNIYTMTMRLYNGSLGTVVDVKSGYPIVEFDRVKNTVFFGKAKPKDEFEANTFEKEKSSKERPNISDLKLAYACTVHKAQGSENSCIVFLCDFFQKNFTSRNMIYTAITRAKRGFWFCGDPNVLANCINNPAVKRVNNLAEHIGRA